MVSNQCNRNSCQNQFGNLTKVRFFLKSKIVVKIYPPKSLFILKKIKKRGCLEKYVYLCIILKVTYDQLQYVVEFSHPRFDYFFD